MARFLNHGNISPAERKKIIKGNVTVLVEFFTEDGEELINVSFK